MDTKKDLLFFAIYSAKHRLFVSQPPVLLVTATQRVGALSYVIVSLKDKSFYSKFISHFYILYILISWKSYDFIIWIQGLKLMENYSHIFQ